MSSTSFIGPKFGFQDILCISFSYELPTRKTIELIKLQGSEEPAVTLLFAFDRREDERLKRNEAMVRAARNAGKDEGKVWSLPSRE